MPLLDPELVPPPEDRQLPAGTVIADRYVIVESIGRGGMGHVYAADQRGLTRQVALKVLLPDLARGRNNLRRFYREARALSALSHEHIVRVFDFGLDRACGLPYIAMELVEGETLSARLNRAGPLPEREAARICAQIAAALVEAHAKGVVHRDLKPANIVLQRRDDGSESVKVLDFGIARLLDTSSEGGQATNTGAILGTPEFMSPEQATGRKAIPRSDLYALGCVFHALLVGRPPFSGFGRVATMVRHASGARPALPGVLDADGSPPSAAGRALHASLLQIDASLRPTDAALTRRIFDAIARGSLVDEALDALPPPASADAAYDVQPGATDSFELRSAPDATTHADSDPRPVATPTPRSGRRAALAMTLGVVAILAVVLAVVIAGGRERDREGPVSAEAPPGADAKRYHHYLSGITHAETSERSPSLVAVSSDSYDVVTTDGQDILRRRNLVVHNLTQGAVPGASEPALSRDGTRIAFSAPDGTWVMNLDGSDRRRVVSFGRSPTWSPDGRHLAVVEFSHPDPNFMPLHDGGLHVVTVATGVSRELETPGGVAYPDWSPDRAVIACTIGWRVWLVWPDGTQPPRRLEEGPWIASAAWRPRFVPGEDALLAITYRHGLPSVIRYQLGSGGGVVAVASVAEGLAGIVDLAVHSPGVAAVVTHDPRPKTELLTLGPDAVVQDRTEIISGQRLATPAFGPAGERLVAVPLGTDERPFVIELASGESRTPVPSDIESTFGGRISPDGRWFSYSGGLFGGEFGVWIGPLSGPFRLVVPDHYVAEWAPDSLGLTVLGPDARPRLVRLDFAGPDVGATLEPDRIGPRWHLFTDFSADGARLAEVDPFHGGVWVRERDSFAARAVHPSGTMALWYQEHLLIGERHRVLLLDPERGESREILDLGDRTLPPSLPLALSPDRRRLVVVSEAPSYRIFELSYREL